MGWRISEIWNELGRLEELIELAFHKSSSIPASVAGTGFWRSLAGVLQPVASIGKQGQIAGVNSGGSDILWQAVWNTWTTVGGGPFTPSPDQTALLVDTTAPQTTITTPANPYDGQMLILYDYEGLAATNPIIISANVANDPTVTVDDPSNPGGTPATSGHIAQQGMTALFKYFASAHQWQLIAVTSPYVAAPNSWAATAWFVDQSNASGLASDLNPGTTSSKPLLTARELIRRWGTSTPTLTATTCTITFLSGSPDMTDPIILTPNLNGTFFLVTMTNNPASGTGVLSGVVANNIPANQALNANLPAGTVRGSLITNTTKGSYARAFKSLGGSLWQITQPIVTLAPGVPSTANPVQDNTWANGDSITVTPPAVLGAPSTSQGALNLAIFQPKQIGLLTGSVNNAPMLRDVLIGVPSAAATGGETSLLGGGCIYVNVDINRKYILDQFASQVWTTKFIGCCNHIGGSGGQTYGQTSFLAGCGFQNSANWPVGISFDCGFMFAGSASLTFVDTYGMANIGTVYVDGGYLAPNGAGQGECLMLTTYNGGQAAIYGTGFVDSRTNLRYTGGAAASFPCSGGVKIKGQTLAYAAKTTAGSTAITQGTLSPAALDGATFNSYAFWPLVGAYLGTTAPP